MEESINHKVEVGGLVYLFKVLKNLTEICPNCGIPACGKENYFWFEYEGQRQTLILDGAILDLVIEQYFDANIEKFGYDSLPNFIKESNEHIGWCIADDFNGTQIDIDDLLKAINMIQMVEKDMKIARGAEYLRALKEMANKAIERQTELLVVRS